MTQLLGDFLVTKVVPYGDLNGKTGLLPSNIEADMVPSTTSSNAAASHLPGAAPLIRTKQGKLESQGLDKENQTREKLDPACETPHKATSELL